MNESYQYPQGSRMPFAATIQFNPFDQEPYSSTGHGQQSVKSEELAHPSIEEPLCVASTQGRFGSIAGINTNPSFLHERLFLGSYDQQSHHSFSPFGFTPTIRSREASNSDTHDPDQLHSTTSSVKHESQLCSKQDNGSVIDAKSSGINPKSLWHSHSSGDDLTLTEELRSEELDL
jgi:hypothetical protein